MHMKSVVIQSFSGLFLFLAGFVIGYLYFTIHIMPLFLGAAIILVIAGTILLISAIRQNNLTKQLAEINDTTPAAETIVIDATHEKSMLERNNELMNDWSKTFETKEKMKMLKIAAAATEEKNEAN